MTVKQPQGVCELSGNLTRGKSTNPGEGVDQEHGGSGSPDTCVYEGQRWPGRGRDSTNTDPTVLQPPESLEPCAPGVTGRDDTRILDDTDLTRDSGGSRVHN